ARARRRGGAPQGQGPGHRHPRLRALARRRPDHHRPLEPAVVAPDRRPVGADPPGPGGARVRPLHHGPRGRRGDELAVRLRTKLLLAQAPLALAIILLGIAASSTTSDLAAKTDMVLRDNYRSVLAAQRMKEAIERIDSGAVFLLLGREADARAQIGDNESRFEAELGVEEHNITEAGEVGAAKKLRAAWPSYLEKLQGFIGKPDSESYFAVLAPGFIAVKDGADEVLAINQDAMVRKSDQAIASAAKARSAIAVVAGLALLAGVVASMVLTTRLLRPLS